jgi:transcriptional regulator with XRE-family HTH domain
MHYGKNLRHIRLLQGMKQELFAWKMGVSQQYVSKLEKLQFIPPKTLEAASKVLGVPVEAIVRFDENTMLLLAAEAKPEDLTRSVKEVIDHFKEELAKKDKRIQELEAELSKFLYHKSHSNG